MFGHDGLRARLAFAAAGGFEGPEGQQMYGGWGGPHPGRFMPWMMRRHFFGGFGGGPRGRAFGRGDVKFALLELLQDGPKHGYEMIKALETRSGGFYTPSAGAIYPTLQLLEDRGWVTSQTVEGKKVFTITDAGREALKEQEQQRGEIPFGPWGHHHHGRGPFGIEMSPELDSLRQEGMQVARLLWAAVLATGGDPARLTQLHGIIASTRSQIEAFLGQQPQQPSGDTPTDTGSIV